MPEDQSPASTVSDAEMNAAFAIPSTFANRFLVTTSNQGARISFGESYSPDKSTHYRGAVSLGFDDALLLSELIQSLIKRNVAPQEEAPQTPVAVDGGNHAGA